jgi:ATP-dependent DNA ligase
MTFQEYLITKRKNKIKPETNKYWYERIIPRGLQELGVIGAEVYVAEYGRYYAPPKFVQLALKAEKEGYFEMALGFWMQAFLAETQNPGSPAEYTTPDGAPISAEVIRLAGEKITSPVFPLSSDPRRHLLPGHLLPMQPVRANWPLSLYIEYYAYLGQPKRNGVRMVVFISNDGKVAYQDRSRNLRPSPSPQLDEAFLAGASLWPRSMQAAIGETAFILDGELLYLDWHGGEHPSETQAAQINNDEGHGEVKPVLRYCIFETIEHGYADFTIETKQNRIIAAQAFYEAICQAAAHPELVEILPTAYTQEEKSALAQTQQKEGREGVVWTLKDAKYIGGKWISDGAEISVWTK